MRSYFSFQKSHFVDSRSKEFFPGSHIISRILCSVTWTENIKPWVCLFLPLSSPVHLYKVTSIAAATLSSNALPCAGTTGYNIKSSVPTCLCLLGADPMSLHAPCLCAFLCILSYVLCVVYCQCCGSLLEDFSFSLPDAGAHSTCIQGKLNGLGNPCSWKYFFHQKWTGS